MVDVGARGNSGRFGGKELACIHSTHVAMLACVRMSRRRERNCILSQSAKITRLFGDRLD